MMELTCAHIFLLFCVVSATPHGYGTKGGASAKAEASASAAAFGDVRSLPLTIPSGSGFSGSYSKSSSSSFSSASSSASSSSSSYSFSGSGSNGLPSFGTNSVAGANGLLGSKEFAGTNNLAGANGFAGTNGNSGANALTGASSFAGAHAIAGSNGLAGPNGNVGANSLAGSTLGCTSGACSAHNKADGVPSTDGSDVTVNDHGYNVANAAAASKATAGTYDFTNGGGKSCVGNDCSNPSSGCSGSDCLNIDINNKCTSGHCGFESLKNNDGCASGKCEHVPQTRPASSSYQSPSECTSGECGLNTQSNLPTIPTYGSNDIPVKKYGATSAPGSKGHDVDKTLPGYHGSSFESGSGSSEETGSQNYSENLNKHNHVHGFTHCDTPNCKGYDYTGTTSSTGSGLPVGHTKPATYLTTPKVQCNSPSCQPDFSTSGGKPSSYNVPLHTTLGVPKQELPCNNGNCGNSQFNHPYPTEPVPCTYPDCAERPTFSTTDCKTPHCAPNYAAAPIGSGNGLIYQPGLPSSGSIPKNPSYASPVIPSLSPSHGHSNPGCTTPGCTGYTNAGSDSGAHSQNGYLSGSSSTTGPNYSTPVIIPSTPVFVHSPHTPVNTGNYGGVGSTTVFAPGQKPATGGYVHGFGAPAGILQPNEFSVPTNTHILAPAHTGPTTANKPSIGASPSAEELPPYTGGFGGPHGLLKPNEFDIKHPSATLNTPTSNASPSEKDHPKYTGGFGAPTGLLKPNEFSSSSNAGATANANAGSFGGSHGLLKPNEFDIKHPSTTLNEPTSNASPSEKDHPKYTGGFGAPTGLLKPNEFSSSSNAGATANANAGSFGTISPHTGVTTPSEKAPIHHGSYGVPTGSLPPGPAHNTGITPVIHVLSPVILQPTPASYPPHQTLPSLTSGSIAPIGPVQPNTYFTSNPAIRPHDASGQIDSHGHHGHIQLPGGPSTVHKNLPTYTGDFGASTGVLKPNDYKDSSNSGYNNAEKPSGTKPTACSSGTCDVKSSNAVAVAKADAVTYTGGFGGPSGLLTPHDSGTINNKLLSNAQLGLNHGEVNGDNDKVLAPGTYGPSGAAAQANAAAQASATAGATSGSFGNENAYSHGQAGVHGSSDKVGNGCGGGCGGGSHYGGGSNFGSSSALSTAKAGAIGGLESGLHGNDASSKSIASAVSGVRAFGGAGSYASSSATAQASAGYATKGGYGK